MRKLWMALWMIVAGAGGAFAQAPMMNGVDLPGRDYNSFWTNDVNQCRASCLGDGRCVAWTWVRPGVQGADGRCWLKNSIPPQQANNCCISSVERSSVPAGMMDNTNLPGRDLRSFWTNDVAQCRAACQGDGQCVAWTWVRPGIQGANGNCWIKGSIPPQEYNNCCISAVERQAPISQRMTFEQPRVDGHFVDHCQQWAQNCDGGGAQLYCQRAGYARAVAWDRFSPGQTIVLGSGQVCTGGFCVGYSRIICER